MHLGLSCKGIKEALSCDMASTDSVGLRSLTRKPRSQTPTPTRPGGHHKSVYQADGDCGKGENLHPCIERTNPK